MSKTTIPTGGLADAAVTTAKITDANITTAKIADDAVTAAKATGLGKIAQVITDTEGSCQTSTSGTSYIDTVFSIDITPSATSSKIYVTFDCGGVYHSTGNGGNIRVRYNDDTTIFETGDYTAYRGSSDIQIGSSIAVLHSPNTTSQKNYKIQIRNRQSSSGTFYIGHPNNSSTMGTFTCMEVLA
tara:strand:+ start:12 stop:566 length:555 start_codon:yes stop_codon:yes gene_type:complete